MRGRVAGAPGHVSDPLSVCVVLVGAVPLQPVGSSPGPSSLAGFCSGV